MRVLVMMGERRTTRANPVWEQARLAARARGVEVQLAFAEDRLWSPRELAREYDGFVLKSRSPIWLNVAAGLSAYARQILNPYHSTLRVLNKFETMIRLQAAGVVAPCSWIAGVYPPPEPPGAGALLLKKVYGHRGEGVRLIERSELGRLAADARGHFLQEEVRGPELKVKVLGARVGAFRRQPHPGEYVVGDLRPVTAELRTLAQRVAELLELTLFGLDVIESDAGLQVIDVNLIPSYRQFPDWADELGSVLAAVGGGGRSR